MTSKNSVLLTLARISAFCCLSTQVFAWNLLTSEIDIHCAQKNEITLSCEYRPLFPGSITEIEASAGNVTLPVLDFQNRGNKTTAVFFLVDTSDPGRQNVINNNVKQIERLLASSNSSHQIGLATFDKKLHILAPIGSSKSDIIESAKKIKAKGRTTELYRNLLLTIEKLSRNNASRKAIYLFSDGQAEDKAYFHADVIKTARKKGVIINGIGFPRSVSLSVALQILRRLSEETGGIYTEANTDFNLDDKFYRNAYDNINVGDSFSIDLGAIAQNASSSSASVRLDLATDIGNIRVDVPVTLPTTSVYNAPITNVTAVPAVATTVIKMVPNTSQPEKVDFWLWYGLPIALVVLFLISIVTLILIYKRQPEKNEFASAVQAQNKPFAYLVTQEEDCKRYPITNTTWRIGRSQDNELSIDDNSISRLHAEIHRYNNGNFFIMDMQSLNGIYVNEEQVSNKKLQEGDIIEIGDIFFRFTHQSEDYQLNDDTAIQKTKSPVH